MTAPRSIPRRLPSSETKHTPGGWAAFVADERALMARIRTGDEAAFDTLVHALYEPLTRLAYGATGSRDTAEDVVTDVFVALWHRAAQIGDTGSLRSYLYRAVRNRALNAARDERRKGAVPLEAAAGIADTQPIGSVTAQQSELEQALAQAVGALSERCRVAWVLSREHGMTYGEIADVMGISVKTVEMHLSRALVALREALKPYLA